MFSERARAKVNLHLHVTGRRDDGYHLLDSLVVFAGAADIVTVAPASRLTLTIDGPFGATLRGDAPANLVTRAARALAAAHGIEPAAAISLEKHLPVASGIGGGSADAAASLRALARLWRLDVPPSPAIALALGADVPVCLAGKPVRMRGIGEILDPAPSLPPFFLTLVNPGVAVATGQVFAALRARAGFSAPASLPLAWDDARAMAGELGRLRNDLEGPAVAQAPAIGDVLAMLRVAEGCLLARMSGSGATCFAIFDDADRANAASRAAADRGWWSWAGPACTA